jgi:hypothetical protein
VQGVQGVAALIGNWDWLVMVTGGVPGTGYWVGSASQQGPVCAGRAKELKSCHLFGEKLVRLTDQ